MEICKTFTTEGTFWSSNVQHGTEFLGNVLPACLWSRNKLQTLIARMTCDSSSIGRGRNPMSVVTSANAQRPSQRCGTCLIPLLFLHSSALGGTFSHFSFDRANVTISLTYRVTRLLDYHYFNLHPHVKLFIFLQTRFNLAFCHHVSLRIVSCVIFASLKIVILLFTSNSYSLFAMYPFHKHTMYNMFLPTFPENTNEIMNQVLDQTQPRGLAPCRHAP